MYHRLEARARSVLLIRFQAAGKIDRSFHGLPGLSIPILLTVANPRPYSQSWPGRFRPANPSLHLTPLAIAANVDTVDDHTDEFHEVKIWMTNIHQLGSFVACCYSYSWLCTYSDLPSGHPCFSYGPDVILT